MGEFGFWGQAWFTVEDESVEVRVPTRPGARVEGRVPRLPDGSYSEHLSIQIELGDGRAVESSPFALVEEDGSFVVKGVPPGHVVTLWCEPFPRLSSNTFRSGPEGGVTTLSAKDWKQGK